MSPDYWRITIVIEALDAGVNHLIVTEVLAKVMAGFGHDGIPAELVLLELAPTH
ncbi:MAG: hypothetical protein ACRDX8_13960 [Acidimicrobiales bacterium]